MSRLLQSVVALQVEALATLRDIPTVPGLTRRLEEMGYDTLVTQELADALALGEAIDDLIDTLTNDVILGQPGLEDLPGLIAQVADVIALIRDFDPPADIAPFDTPGFAAQFARFCLDDMVRSVLRRRFPHLNLVLFITGAIRTTPVTVPGPDGDREVRIERLDLTALGDFLTDPAGTLSARFGLTTGFWQGEELNDLVRHLGNAGLWVVPRRVSVAEAAATTTIDLDPGDLAYEVMLLRGVVLGTGARRDAGLRLIPRPDQGRMGVGIVASADMDALTLPLSPDWEMELGLASEDIVLATIAADGVTAEPVTATAAVTLRDTRTEPMILLGEADATRLELGDLELGATITFGADSDVALTLALRELTLHVMPGDGLLREILGNGFGTTLDLDIGWSGTRGVTFGGSAGFQYTLPSEITFGPVTLGDLTFEIAARDTGPAATVTTTLLAELGPFDATVGGMGLRLSLVEAANGTGLIGPYDLRAGAEPPNRFGFSLDLPAVKGGGFLSIEGGRYSGALAIDVMSVGISAITVIDTDLPETPQGWAFFAALTLQFPAIPLGFGFTLSGLGGLVALNRGIDTIAIATGLKDGVVDALLFPEDPVRDAPMIISMIDDYFPILGGNTVIGPIVELGWGAPKTLLTAQLGVMISIPQGRIALLGSIAIALPTPDAPLLSLKLDLLGEIDVPAGTLFMMASLYDSRLLETIELSGDMGAFLATRGQPYFLLSVGGYHPGFEPPALVPAPLHDLRRMSAGITIGENVSLTIESYFAITSNTVQFGAALELRMSAKVAFKTYVARGGFSFDVMLRFDPFAIVADFEAHIGVYSGDRELLGVFLVAHLEGPRPWFASGRATFKFFGLEVSFDVEVGGTAPAEQKARVPLRDDVVAALRAPQSWAEAPPRTGVVAGVTFLDPPPPSEDATAPVWARPDHLLRVSQGIAPLNRVIEVVGQGLPAEGDALLTLDDAGLGDLAVAWSPVQDWFAPAQFEALDQREKLSRASFEEMDAGVTFGDAAPQVTAQVDLCREATLDHEEVWWEPEAATVLKTARLDAGRAGSVAAQALNHTAARPVPRFAVTPVAFGVVDAITGLAQTGALPTPTGQGAALAAAGPGTLAVSAATLEIAA